MSDYDNTNTGALFFEQDKDSDRHPDYKGSVNVNGKEYWISAWDKVSKKGTNFISLSVKAKEAEKSDMWPVVTDTQKVPVVGTIEPDGTIQLDKPINLDDIPF